MLETWTKRRRALKCKTIRDRAARDGYDLSHVSNQRLEVAVRSLTLRCGRDLDEMDRTAVARELAGLLGLVDPMS